MSDMWADLAPVLFAMMVSPARSLAVIILLHTPRRAVTAIAYVGGMIGAMMVQGSLMGASMRIVGLTDASNAASLDTFIGALFFVGGVVLLVGAFKIANPTGDGSGLKAMMTKLETVEPRTALKIGFGWLFASPKQWVFTLTAVSIIFAAQLRPAAALANYLLFAAIVQLAYLVIIGLYAMNPDRVDRWLTSVFDWTRANIRAVALTVFIGFGVVFLLKAFAILGG